MDSISTAADTNKPKHGLFVETVEQIPSAAGDLLREAWHHPVDTAMHAGETVLTAGIMGAVLGHFIPTGGPAGLLVGAAFTVPLLIQGYERIAGARRQMMRPGASETAIAHALAMDTLGGAGNLLLTFGAGWGGTEAGHLTATSDGLLGDLGQSSQRAILERENKGLSSFASLMKPLNLAGADTRVASREMAALGERAGSQTAAATGVLARPASDPELMTGLEQKLGLLKRRVSQYTRQRSLAEGALGARLEPAEELKIYTGSVHGHSRYSDGMGLPSELYAKAQAGGEQVTFITDHDHPLSRRGVPEGDPRSSDESGTPIITADPAEYAQTFVDANAATRPGQFVAGVGTEVGTIGKPGTPHNGPVGVNHINLFELPTFYEAVVRQPSRFQMLMNPLRRLLGIEAAAPELVPPDVVKFNDGDYAALARHLSHQKATDGGTPIVQLNHPRASAELAADIPKNLRFADYGKLSFDPKNPDNSIRLWLENFAKPYVRQMELIKGEALNPDVTDTVKPSDIDLNSYLVYMDRGVKASPTFGRDFHYGDPVGRPAGTIFLSRALDKPSILETLRERRTGATTSRTRLVGSLWANDAHPMGSILDQSAVPDLNLKVQIEGEVTPDARYTVSLLGDTRIGDGKLATTLQTKELTGQELLDGGQQVSFGTIKHTLGNRSAYFVQVDRAQPALGDYVDHMWTAPIWIEPASRATHSLLVRGMFTAGANLFVPASGTAQ